MTASAFPALPTPEHWAVAYIGLPWEAGARGPRSFDCWGLVRHVLQTKYQRECPEYNLISPGDVAMSTQAMKRALARPSLWEEIPAPLDGCVVAMSHTDVMHHVGVYVQADSGLVLHAMDRQGVLAQPLVSLANYNWRTVKFYRLLSWLKTPPTLS